MLASGDPSAEQVKDLIFQQCSHRATLIVAAGKSDNDDGVDLGLRFVQSPDMDPTGVRTMRVHTFWKTARPVRKLKISKQIEADRQEEQGGGKTAGHVLPLKEASPGIWSTRVIPARPSVVVPYDTEEQKQSARFPDDYEPGVPDTNQGIERMVSRLAMMLGPLARRQKDELKRQFESVLKKTQEELDACGPGQENASSIIASNLRGLKNILRKEVVRLKDTTLHFLELNKKMKMMDGARLDEMELDWWRPVNFELPQFQGYKAVKDTVQNQITKWEGPIKEMLTALKESYLEKVVKEDIMQGEADKTEGATKPSSEAIAIIKEKWQDLLTKQIAEAKRALVETGSQFDEGLPQSAIEQAYSVPPVAKTHRGDTQRELNAILDRELPVKVLESYKKLPNGTEILQKIKDNAEMFDDENPFDITVDKFDLKVVPDMVKNIAIIRDRCKRAAVGWIGDKDSGAYEQVIQQCENRAKELNMAFDQMVDELGDKDEDEALRSCLGHDPYLEKRKKLRERKELITEAIELVKQIGNPVGVS